MTRRFVHDDDDSDVEIEGASADRESDLALLCVLPHGNRRIERWIPKSQIHDDSEVWRAGQSGKLVITGWFADKEGLS